MSKTDDPSVQHLGEVALQWVDKDLKKATAPFFNQGGDKNEGSEKSENDE